MRRIGVKSLPVLLISLTLLFSDTGLYAGDARRGARIFQEQCALCHPILGRGDGEAPDLGKRALQGFSPAWLAAQMWNHGPEMWRQMADWKMEIPDLGPEAIDDLSTYFYSLRYYEPLGDPARGEALFVSKNCHRCHALVETDAGAKAPPVPKWTASSEPIPWIQQMWNHGGQMESEMEKDRIAWPTISSQEMTDLLTFVRGEPAASLPEPAFGIDSPGKGERVFRSHGCDNCHAIRTAASGKITLFARTQSLTLLDLAAVMWNHRPWMQSMGEGWSEPKRFRGTQMAELLSYLLDQRYLQRTGDAERGQKLFQEKGCAACHDRSTLGAPVLPAGDQGYSAYDFASDAWLHGPIMYANLDALGLEWPQVSEEDVADLASFLGR
jgi:mono/diheme cytochrome c family protein